MTTVNAHNGFDKLTEVWLGDTYPVDFYYDFDTEIRDAFIEITEITKQDLNKIQDILTERNITVQRPEFTDNRQDYVDQRTQILMKPPIMPRDTELALGNEFYHLRADYKVDPWHKQISEMMRDNIVVHIGETGTDLSCMCPPSIVRCGKDIYIDITTHEHVMPQIASTFIEWSKHYRVHLISTGGHSDGMFCPVSEGLIVSTHWLNTADYASTFPDWEIFNLVKEIPPTEGAANNWWVPDSISTNSSLFAEHIETRAMDWIGNYKETQFSVNMLILDNKTVLAVNQNPLLSEFLDKKGFEVIIADFRAKSFWDGGMHCLTCDVSRLGHKTDYFPQRPNTTYLDWL